MVTLRIDKVATLYACQESPGFRSVIDARVSITSRTVESDTMNGAATVTRHLLTGDIGLERLEFSLFRLRSELLNIFLANLIHRNITSVVKHLFHVCIDLHMHLAIP